MDYSKELRQLWQMAEAGGPHACQWALAYATLEQAHQLQTRNDIMGRISEALATYVIEARDKRRG